MTEQDVDGAPRERMRPFTWVIIAINILIVILSIALYADYRSNCNGLVDACAETGASIFIWILTDGFVLTFVNVALGVLWLVTRRRQIARRPIPVADSQPSPQWVQDPSDPAVLRWWDGRQYTHDTAARQDWRG